MPVSSASGSALAAIGWRADSPAGEAIGSDPSGRLARVVEQHRSHYVVSDGAKEMKVQPPAPWTRKDFAP
jgi:ribosome biogenesis GTPase